MPLPATFADRLLPILPDLVEQYGTPFHIYHANGIVAAHQRLTEAFGAAPYRQHFAVKALPNPHVLQLLIEHGSGLDCSSQVELDLAEYVGCRGDDVVFTSNNTPLREYRQALAQTAIITFDDLAMLDKVDVLPEVVSFRVAPHGLAAGSRLMGDARRSKFGIPAGDLLDAYRTAWARGARRFGLHGMTCANEMDGRRAARGAADVIELAAQIGRALGVDLEYVNIGGGLGIPYHEGESQLDLEDFASWVIAAWAQHFPKRRTLLRSEFGRCVTGPHGVLVSRVINRSQKGHTVIGLDASMSALMRPAMYGAYHHISLPLADERPVGRYDVVGSLCENMDKFATDRTLPAPREGDIVLVHDTGAHGHAMGFTYNGRLRPAELMIDSDGDVMEIRRAETLADHLATVAPTPVTVRVAERHTPQVALGDERR